VTSESPTQVSPVSPIKRDAAVPTSPSTAAHGNDEVMSQPAKPSDITLKPAKQS
jgi:hypothetical protein